MMATAPGQGCSPKKKKWGTPETRLTQRFFNNLGLHTCCTKIILHCVSVSNQLQQWTNFCTNFSPKKWGSGGRFPPVEKSGGTPSPRVLAPLHPWRPVDTRTRAVGGDGVLEDVEVIEGVGGGRCGPLNGRCWCCVTCGYVHTVYTVCCCQ